MSSNHEDIIDGVQAILETPEILNLIDEGQRLSIQISRPLVDPLEHNEETLRGADCQVDLSSKNNKISRYINKQTPLSTRTYNLEILNGIHRMTHADDREKTCEERCFLVTDSTYVPWVVTIRNRCSDQLMPMIIDYDQRYQIEDTTYPDDLHKIALDNEVRYEITKGLNFSVISAGDPDEIFDDIKEVVTDLDRTYKSIFD